MRIFYDTYFVYKLMSFFVVIGTLSIFNSIYLCQTKMPRVFQRSFYEGSNTGFPFGKEL